MSDDGDKNQPEEVESALKKESARLAIAAEKLKKEIDAHLEQLRQVSESQKKK